MNRISIVVGGMIMLVAGPSVAQTQLNVACAPRMQEYCEAAFEVHRCQLSVEDASLNCRLGKPGQSPFICAKWLLSQPLRVSLRPLCREWPESLFRAVRIISRSGATTVRMCSLSPMTAGCTWSCYRPSRRGGGWTFMRMR